MRHLILVLLIALLAACGGGGSVDGGGNPPPVVTGSTIEVPCGDANGVLGDVCDGQQVQTSGAAALSNAITSVTFDAGTVPVLPNVGVETVIEMISNSPESIEVGFAQFQFVYADANGDSFDPVCGIGPTNYTYGNLSLTAGETYVHRWNTLNPGICINPSGQVQMTLVTVYTGPITITGPGSFYEQWGPDGAYTNDPANPVDWTIVDAAYAANGAYPHKRIKVLYFATP